MTGARGHLAHARPADAGDVHRRCQARPFVPPPRRRRARWRRHAALRRTGRNGVRRARRARLECLGQPPRAAAAARVDVAVARGRSSAVERLVVAQPLERVVEIGEVGGGPGGSGARLQDAAVAALDEDLSGPAWPPPRGGAARRRRSGSRPTRAASVRRRRRTTGADRRAGARSIRRCISPSRSSTLTPLSTPTVARPPARKSSQASPEDRLRRARGDVAGEPVCAARPRHGLADPVLQLAVAAVPVRQVPGAVDDVVAALGGRQSVGSMRRGRVARRRSPSGPRRRRPCLEDAGRARRGACRRARCRRRRRRGRPASRRADARGRTRPAGRRS